MYCNGMTPDLCPFLKAVQQYNFETGVKEIGYEDLGRTELI